MIAELRAALKLDLETGSDGAATPIGVPVHDPYPGRVVAPCAVLGMEPAGYIVGGQTFCREFEVRMTVVLLVSRSEHYLDELEKLIEIVLENTADWGMTGVDAPGSLVESGMELLGTTVHLSKMAKLIEGA
jgi:hypothetical protein